MNTTHREAIRRALQLAYNQGRADKPGQQYEMLDCDLNRLMMQMTADEPAPAFSVSPFTPTDHVVADEAAKLIEGSEPASGVAHVKLVIGAVFAQQLLRTLRKVKP